jgi:hypothetical protein
MTLLHCVKLVLSVVLLVLPALLLRADTLLKSLSSKRTKKKNRRRYSQHT